MGDGGNRWETYSPPFLEPLGALFGVVDAGAVAQALESTVA